MCGITGTTFTKDLDKSSRVEPHLILDRLMNTDNILTNQEIDKLYEFSVAYKSDINFINYFESDNERKIIEKLVNTLKNKYDHFIKNETNESKSYSMDSWINDRDKILDAIWFLDDELTNRYNFVINLLGKHNKYPKHSLQFFKILNSIINSINLLEMRGRDSLGMCFQFVLEKNEINLELYNELQINKQYLCAITNNHIVINAIYRTFNRIGSLGENANIILNSFMNDSLIINLINSGKYESVSIIAHTRWASVGSVNSKNIHPLVNIKTTTDEIPATFAFVNGDIYNFREIYNNMVWKKKVDYNLNQENDSIALAYLFSEKNCFTHLQKIKNNLSKIVGSITGNVLSHEDPQKILIIKKGSQGMFLGKNKDRIYFASDAYGLVEDCNKVYNLDDNCFGLIDEKSKASGLKIYNLDSTIKKRITDKDYAEIIISSRDVSKKLFNHYLLKEIYESKDIVESTLRRYVEL